MAIGERLNVALKEWDIVCKALETGRQTILLRKGGISESIGGFQLEHPTFLLFPTFLHQNKSMLKPDAHGGFTPCAEEPARITMSGLGQVTDIVRLKSRAQMDALDAEHIWTPPLIDMRFNYRPANPLYLLIVRAMKLPAPVTVDNTPAYAGCKSWVPLEQAVDISGATPAIGDTEFESRRQRIRGIIEKN